MTHIKSATCRFRNSLFSVGALVVGLSLANVPSTAFAELSVTGSGALFYTDNANLFSATRRSSLDGDPSQPVLDTSSFGHAKDMVFEPAVRVMKFIPSSWGQTAFTAKVRGFIYSVNPEFSQAGIYLEGVHAFNSDTAIRLRFFSSPDQLLGQAEVEHDGIHRAQDARVTSNIGAVRFDKRLSEHFEVQLYGRAGIRRFNQPFTDRDTLFWTIGPHFVWHMTHHARMVLGYHYERGLAEGRHHPDLHDDSSYVHHFASVALEADLMENLELELDFHYERNNYTSGIPEDEHHFLGGENIFLGSGRLLYQLTDNSALTLTVQRANRSLHAEHVGVQAHNTNVGLGVFYRF
ncbi:MAG: hypothetical protein OEV01_02100 [Nitrospira sp.]|nr:hypothetical protein [Nitrospira sp.]MDH4303513.1 hypothetical protein [Nitrospira sp.]MDH5192628.1 hypothetical protein [Nitrospira sp.]